MQPLTLPAKKTSRPYLPSRRLTRPLTAGMIAGMTVVLVSMLAACSGDNDPTQDTGSHNSADVTFATEMIPHHAQAVVMADMALTQARSSDVLSLAKQIKAAQTPEIEKMSGWLDAWSEPVPDTDSMAGMDHEMEGMMSRAEMDSLSQSSGRAFDRLWLTLMVQHHRGAIEMAKTELAEGTSGEAQMLADDIISAQHSEVLLMNQLLDNLAS